MVKQRVIVTGAGGQLGTDLVSLLLAEGYEVHGLTRSELDFSSQDEVDEVIGRISPDVIIHSGAYTKVDQAEAEVGLAFKINGDGAGFIAQAAEKAGAKLVYVSTDYVFDGTAVAPIAETAATSPVNVYGASKLEGERQTLAFSSKAFVVRTSWVYGLHGSNFVRTMLQLARQGKPLSVVGDQFGCPTFTRDLAGCIVALIRSDRYGVYHVSNSGSCSWHEFAAAIFEEAGLSVQLQAVTSDQFVRPAIRPGYSVFAHEALAQGGFPVMRHWREALQQFLAMENLGAVGYGGRRADSRHS
ncbi:dTDP-4-dehydrorhamnose reductase [Paenibacillus pasadenensis]|uniref:dTDP-4-dehydrorhamnose reductase n=1 Tax=Paenibacillus pasadenensis TaxID=217090 RepID=UPI002040C030|nr:dTDP-4-dehydrorhamnose reductase [Paenibacillus pasadenensis]MCM3749147.1 dTDP-4-dehydrorhamnose reductase [Paenibacillus pasadenensis]